MFVVRLPTRQNHTRESYQKDYANRLPLEMPLGIYYFHAYQIRPIYLRTSPKGRRNDVRLIGRKLGEVANPRAADAEAKQDERQDAAR